ncbi:MAG: ion transporter [Clostridia bacterium]|nr:ion transporter [Clostridia bacterium]
MNKKTFRRLMSGIVFYILLLVLLVLAEKPAPGATIRGFGDALWFSLVTLTTVGFGDLTPVTLPGKLIAFVFLLMSVGLLAFLLGLTWNLFRNALLPRLRLSALSRCHCVVFSELNAASEALGADLIETDPKVRLLFCSAESLPPSLPAGRAVCLPLPAESALPLLSARAPITLCLISADEGKNRDAAERLSPFRGRILCRGKESGPADSVSFFNDAAGIARAYWLAHPLRSGERVILLIGEGPLAEELLAQAALMNCRAPLAAAEYHLFGDWAAFRRLHPVLCAALSPEASETPQDRLIFHGAPWNGDFSLLAGADRIIFCGENPALNAERAAELFRWIPAAGSVYARADSLPAPGIPFGAPREVWTVDLVFRSVLDRQARLLHHIYAGGQDHPEPWESLSPFLKDSNRASADHLETKLRLLLGDSAPVPLTPDRLEAAFARWQSMPDREPFRRVEHERWCRYYELYNWRPGVRKDPLRRTHPALVPYDDLSPEERAKDDSAWLLIGRLAKETNSVRERAGEAAAESSAGQKDRRELPVTEEETDE